MSTHPEQAQVEALLKLSLAAESARIDWYDNTSDETLLRLKQAREALRSALVAALTPQAPARWDASQIKPPGWDHVFAAFVAGAQEARENPLADESDFHPAADGYTKRVFEEVDPVSEAALRTESWAQAPAEQPEAAQKEALQTMADEAQALGLGYEAAEPVPAPVQPTGHHLVDPTERSDQSVQRAAGVGAVQPVADVEYGRTDFGYELFGIDVPVEGKRLMAMIVMALGNRHPAVDDLMKLLLLASRPAAADREKQP